MPKTSDKDHGEALALSPLLMAKKNKTSAKPIRTVRTAAERAELARMKRIAAHAFAAIVLCGAIAFGVAVTKKHVERDVVFQTEPPKVVLKDRPVWMSDFLADQIANSARPLGTHSPFDHDVLVEMAHQLSLNPWIRTVRAVRRCFGTRPGDTIELDCDYRAPVALVHWKDYFWLVDGMGVKLPEQFTADQVPRILLGRDGKMNVRIVEGVRQPPVESGHVWPGADLAAGLDLAKLLYAQPYAEEIVKVDVTNFGGRENPRDAQLTLVTRYGTGVKWGRPINAKDFFVEVSTAQKLRDLQLVREQYGRVDAGQPWIDIRFDKITYPNATDASASAQ